MVRRSTDKTGVDTTKPPSMWQMTKLMADSELREAGNKVRSPHGTGTPLLGRSLDGRTSTDGSQLITELKHAGIEMNPQVSDEIGSACELGQQDRPWLPCLPRCRASRSVTYDCRCPKCIITICSDKQHFLYSMILHAWSPTAFLI